LRTLEFWVDNLNPEFLFPELSKQKDILVSLMKALSTHLRPAPYPYGLLTLRLLGKLGGKNRRVLRDPIDIDRHSEGFIEEMSLDFSWSINVGTRETEMGRNDASSAGLSFPIRLPINRCVDFLKRAAIEDMMARESSQRSPVIPQKATNECLRLSNKDRLLSINVEDIDLLPYCQDVIEQTRKEQAQAALQVLRTALTKIMNVEDGNLKNMSLDNPDAKTEEAKTSEETIDMQTIATRLDEYNNELQTITLGFMFGCCLEALAANELIFVRGLLAHIYSIVVCNHHSIVRIDANGSSLTFAKEEEQECAHDEFGVFSEENLGSLKPFGYFELNGPLQYTADPLALNKALADFLSHPSASFNDVGLGLLKYTLGLPKTTGLCKDETLDRGSLIFFESLLGSLSEKCMSTDWSRRDGLYDALCLMVQSLGAAWGRRYENELMNVALFSVKSVPKEMAVAGVKSIQFLVRLCSCLYGKPDFLKNCSSSKMPMFDLLSIWKKKDTPKSEESPMEETSKPTNVLTTPCDDVLQLLIIEMASTKNLSR
jgi:transformation/transcription domain-associated protein